MKQMVLTTNLNSDVAIRMKFRHLKRMHVLPAPPRSAMEHRERAPADASTTIVAPPVRCSLGQLLPRSCVLSSVAAPPACCSPGSVLRQKFPLALVADSKLTLPCCHGQLSKLAARAQ